ncbi:unnamed protein product [Mycena citricolor]|uniref:DUF4100 domain-containing protein n=1 Tax=Mycena citricolor TaxID=2018698 RepID=A0AAD2HJA6_9AGAR|nr:unnamed protein product [Mycena citricolor]
MAANATMPARGARGAPEFDSKQPRELPRYFSDLEFHFTAANITDPQEKKRQAIRYLSFEDAELWESLDSFSPGIGYEAFKAAVAKLYPGTDADRRYALADLHTLIGEYASVGILSRADYSEFYRKFLVITKFLVAKGRLSAAEQSRSFRRAISPPTLWNRVHQRLQIKQPDVHPDDPYDLADLNEAMEFVLADSSYGSAAPPSALLSPTPVKKESADPGISQLIESMNGLMKVLAAQAAVTAQAVAAQQSTRPPPPTIPVNSTPRDLSCSYCSEHGHFIIRCPHVDEDIQSGKCKRNTDGQVVLLSGAYIPRRIMGVNLRARFDEYHRQNPGQMAAQNMVEVSTHFLTSNPAAPEVSTFALSDAERIQSLEREILAMRTRSQARAALDRSGDRVEAPERVVRPAAQSTPAPARVPAPASAPAPAPVTRPPAAIPATAPEHPYAKAKDAAYAPPRDHNVGARAPVVPAKKTDPAYRSVAPVYDPKHEDAVFGRILGAKIENSIEEILSISPGVRSRMSNATTSRRVPPTSGADSKPPAVSTHIYDDFSHRNMSDSAAIEPLDAQTSNNARDAAFLDSMPAAQ